MRSFYAKIFLCMLLVPVLARGAGLLLETTLSDPRPLTERMLVTVLPTLVTLSRAALDHGDMTRLQAEVRVSSHNFIQIVPAPPGGCGALRGWRAVAPLAGTPYCVAGNTVARPLILGLIPATWWFVMPVLELMFGGLVGIFLARYLAEPIRRTRAAAAAFAAGDLSARAASARRSRRRDEAADLAREFDRMADRISAMIAAQNRFIGDVSHEIRSPLARLAMALGLMRRDAGSALAANLDRMEHEVEAMSGLVRELLALASLQGAVEPPKPRPVDLSAVVDQVVEDMTFEFQDRAHAIRVIRRPVPVRVLGDVALLRRAIENVLRNALFYTPDNAEVEVLLGNAGGVARVVIRDHGPGVPDTALPKLFRPFFRVDEARARNTGGIGLGLAITHRAIELHGGRIEALNIRPHGLAIRIELPAWAEHSEMVRASDLRAVA